MAPPIDTGRSFMEEKETSSDLSENTQQRMWEPPVIEELDFGATESIYAGFVLPDGGLYTV
jgi:hypothetical protein